MYGIFDITYNGRSGSSIGVYAVKRPSIPSPERRVEKITVPGRDGSLFIEDGWDDVTFDTVFNWFDAADDLGDKTREFNSWLSQTGGKLLFSDDLFFYRIVRRIEMRQTERVAPQIMKQTVRFTVDPWQYLTEGDTAMTNPTSLTNPTNWTAHPVIQITGGGTWTLTINGNSITAVVTNGLIIDTLRETITWDGENKSSLVTGDISKLVLQPGANTITKSSGATVTITPRWRTL